MPSAYRTLAAAALLAVSDGLAAPPRRLPTPSPKVRHCDAAHGAAPRLLAPAAGASPGGYVGVYKPPGWRVEPLASALPAGVERAPDVRTWLAATTGAVGAAVFDLDVDCGGCVAFALPGAAAADPATAEFVAVLSGSLAAPRGELAGARYVARTGGAWTGHGTVVDVVARVPPEAAGRRAPSLAVREAFAALGNPVRGDARFGEPIDRAAPRALIHCAKIKVGGAAFAAPRVEDDMALACGGAAADARAALRASDSTTTAYRAVHGEADGAAGTTVDRYGDYAVVARADGSAAAGDGAAVKAALAGLRGVYDILAVKDRSRGDQLPVALAAGEAAPAPLAVTEAGVRYEVDLGARLSTGLFLDQRPQRAWLSAHADGMRVLNLFAHAGGYSAAAAVGGAAMTRSVDLDAKWMAKLDPLLAANGIAPDKDVHDTISGDVFAWIPRLAKRGDLYDLVILDPPSTSVGKKKKRWSAAKDYPALVTQAAALVAPGGLLWTTTNARKILPRQFARMCAAALPPGSQLIRANPPAADYPVLDGDSAGVKNLVWQLPE